MFKEQIGIPDMLFIYDPDEIEKYFRNEGIWPLRQPFGSMEHYRGVMRKEIFGGQLGIVQAQGESWHKLRTVVNPIFLQPRVAKKYIAPIDSVASDFIERIKFLAKANENGEMPKDFIFELNKWSFESIGVIALDRRLGCVGGKIDEEAQQMARYMDEVMKMMIILDYTPIGPYIIRYNLPIWKRFVKYQDYFLNMTLKYLDEAEEKIKSTDIYKDKSENEKSIFEKLVKIDKQVAMVVTLDSISAGIDTTGNTMAATLYHVAKNPKVQNKLRDELMKVLPTPDTPITEEILNNIPYLKAVLKEVGRISPVAAGATRTTIKDLVFSGYQVPAGQTIIVPNLYLSTSEKYYPHPKEFIPERWLKTTTGELSYRNTNRFITMPFGFGARSCIGQRLANLEMEVLLAKIIRNFKLEWPHPDIRFQQILLHTIKDPLKIHVKAI